MDGRPDTTGDVEGSCSRDQIKRSPVSVQGEWRCPTIWTQGAGGTVEPSRDQWG